MRKSIYLVFEVVDRFDMVPHFRYDLIFLNVVGQHVIRLAQLHA